MQMETKEALLKKYETLIEELFKAENWLKNKGDKTWEDIRKYGGRNGLDTYNKYKAKEKEVYELQKVLHKHMGIVSCG